MKRSNIFWGTILVLIAILLLLKQFNIINNVFSYFWVIALMVAGLWLIFGAFNRSAKTPGEKVMLALEGATSARLKLDFGAGRLNLRSGAVAGNLLEGECNPAPVIRTRTDANHLDARLKTASDFWAWAPGQTREWDLALAGDVPLALKIDCGASITTLDLRDLKISELDLETGASTTDITLPAAAGYTRVKIESGAATVCVRIPEGVAAQIRVESGLASVDVASRFTKVGGKLYLSPDYASAANRAEISIETGMASVEIV